MRTIMITRHAALVEYAREIGLVPDDVEVLPHVTDPEQLRGCHVVGPLPLHLAVHAECVTHIPIEYPRDGSLRGVELTIEQLREMAGEPQEFAVRPSSRARCEREDLAEARKILPAATSETPPLEAIRCALAQWAKAQGLIEVNAQEAPDGPGGLTETLACELVELSRLEPPPGGRIESVYVLAGVPVVRAAIRLRTCSSSVCFRRAAEGV